MCWKQMLPAFCCKDVSHEIYLKISYRRKCVTYTNIVHGPWFWRKNIFHLAHMFSTSYILSPFFGKIIRYLMHNNILICAKIWSKYILILNIEIYFSIFFSACRHIRVFHFHLRKDWHDFSGFSQNHDRRTRARTRYSHKKLYQ